MKLNMASSLEWLPLFRNGSWEAPLVTFVITTFNQEDSVARCIESLPWRADHQWEAVVVDDCSTDSTLDIVSRLFEENRLNEGHRLLVETMDSNSGGPSAPRNRGLDLARGEYIFFLDGDDQLISENFDYIADHVVQTSADLVRLPMQIVIDGGPPRVVDRVTVGENSDSLATLERCVTLQSMGVMAFSRRSIIMDNGIRFKSDVRMGEDLVFMSEFCRHSRHFSYYDSPLYTYHKSSRMGSSSTANYSGEVFVEAIHSWDLVQENYLKIGIDFLACHGAGTVSYGLGQLQKCFVRVSEQEFANFSQFVGKWAHSLNLDLFGEPFRILVEDALSQRYDRFLEHSKLRMLIAGSDLKFIKSAVPYLEEYFQVHLDEWQAERVFDEDSTKRELAWAQIIWCEWMTMAAEYFSHNVRPSQQLFIRCHFYELTRDSGFKVDDSKVNGYIAIALHTYEDLIEKFGIARSKVHLIPNYYAVDSYERDHTDGDPFAIALIGSVPRRKGLHRALEILRDLRKVDQRYSLTVFGKAPEAFGWVNGVAEERKYYKACRDFVENNDLSDHVVNAGWADIRKELAKFGYVLSTSDFEGSHVAPGEAFCADIPMGILNWRGAEYVYPSEFIFCSVDEITQDILDKRESVRRTESLAKGRDFLRRHQDVSQFVEDVVCLVQNN